MQSNIYTSKIIKPSKTKQETSEKGVKTAYRGRDKVATWERGANNRFTEETFEDCLILCLYPYVDLLGN